MSHSRSSTPHCESAFEKGKRWGASFKLEGRDYGKINGGHYPSNIYPHGSDDAKNYDAGYEEGFNGMA